MGPRSRENQTSVKHSILYQIVFWAKPAPFPKVSRESLRAEFRILRICCLLRQLFQFQQCVVAHRVSPYFRHGALMQQCSPTFSAGVLLEVFEVGVAELPTDFAFDDCSPFPVTPIRSGASECSCQRPFLACSARCHQDVQVRFRGIRVRNGGATFYAYQSGS
jgi:hypothetical protein